MSFLCAVSWRRIYGPRSRRRSCSGWNMDAPDEEMAALLADLVWPVDDGHHDPDRRGPFWWCASDGEEPQPEADTHADREIVDEGAGAAVADPLEYER